MIKEHLWHEKYRPHTVSDCCLPTAFKERFMKYVPEGGGSPETLVNFIFNGTPGCGKTTLAKALAEELGMESHFINASMSGNIDTLREDIMKFVSTVSLTAGSDIKVVILDEADYLNAQSTQPALRGFIEEYSSVARFVLTCNNKNRIIEPLRNSRFEVVDFHFNKAQKIEMCKTFHKRTLSILEKEQIEVPAESNKLLADLIMKRVPDFRSVLNTLQTHSQHDKVITPAILTSLVKEGDIEALVAILKSRKFADMRLWVRQNADSDLSGIYKAVYGCAKDHVEPAAIGDLIILVHDYMSKRSFVADEEVSVTAFLAHVMQTITFKA